MDWLKEKQDERIQIFSTWELLWTWWCVFTTPSHQSLSPCYKGPFFLLLHGWSKPTETIPTPRCITGGKTLLFKFRCNRHLCCLKTVCIRNTPRTCFVSRNEHALWKQNKIKWNKKSMCCKNRTIIANILIFKSGLQIEFFFFFSSNMKSFHMRDIFCWWILLTVNLTLAFLRCLPLPVLPLMFPCCCQIVHPKEFGICYCDACLVGSH